MTDNQRNQYNAAVNGDQVLTNHATDFSTDTPLQNKQTTLQAEILKIEQDAQKQRRNTGHKTVKDADVDAMGQNAWEIMGIGIEYFKSINDTVQEHKITFTKSELLYDSVVNMKKNAQTIFDAINPIILAIVGAGYNITAGKVTLLQTQINQLTTDEGKPAADKADTVAATAALKADFPVLKGIEDSIFNLLRPYAGTNLPFYDAAMDGFEVLDIAIRHIAAWIIVSDNATNVRLMNAQVRITGTGVDETKKSSRRGIVYFSHQLVIEGNYTIEITLPGYTPQTLTNQAIYNDRMSRFEVKLVKI